MHYTMESEPLCMPNDEANNFFEANGLTRARAQQHQMLAGHGHICTFHLRLYARTQTYSKIYIRARSANLMTFRQRKQNVSAAQFKRFGSALEIANKTFRQREQNKC